MHTPPLPQYIDVRINGRLLFKYDPTRHIVEVRTRGETHHVDLAQLDQQAAPCEPVQERPETVGE